MMWLCRSQRGTVEDPTSPKPMARQQSSLKSSCDCTDIGLCAVTCVVLKTKVPQFSAFHARITYPPSPRAHHNSPKVLPASSFGWESHAFAFGTFGSLLCLDTFEAQLSIRGPVSSSPDCSSLLPAAQIRAANPRRAFHKSLPNQTSTTVMVRRPWASRSSITTCSTMSTVLASSSAVRATLCVMELCIKRSHSC